MPLPFVVSFRRGGRSRVREIFSLPFLRRAGCPHPAGTFSSCSEHTHYVVLKAARLAAQPEESPKSGEEFKSHARPTLQLETASSLGIDEFPSRELPHLTHQRLGGIRFTMHEEDSLQSWRILHDALNVRNQIPSSRVS